MAGEQEGGYVIEGSTAQNDRIANGFAARTSALPRCSEDVVRYLHQQHDVVVPQADGEFLVNGRFRLGLAELVSRVNQMRSRHGQPEFRSTNGRTSPSANSGTSKGHPIFWEEPKSAQSGSKPASAA